MLQFLSKIKKGIIQKVNDTDYITVWEWNWHSKSNNAHVTVRMVIDYKENKSNMRFGHWYEFKPKFFIKQEIK